MSDYHAVVRNPGNVVWWGVDQKGGVRLGLTLTDRFKVGFIYRENEKAPWHALPSPDESRGEIQVLGFDCWNEKLYVAALSPKGRWAIYPFDPATGALGHLVVDDPLYDVVPARRPDPKASTALRSTSRYFPTKSRRWSACIT